MICPACSGRQMDDGTALYLMLARDVIGRVLSIDVTCDPPGDVRLRLESLVHERDRAVALLREIIADPNASITNSVAERAEAFLSCATARSEGRTP